jgi:hypothetical protein
MGRPDPELLPTQRPRCPHCKVRMLTADVTPGPEGFEQRTFDCRQCNVSEKKFLIRDPLKAGPIGWLRGELGGGH